MGKKRGIGKFIVLGVLLLAVGIGAWFAGSLLGWFPPKDLGVRYTEADFKSAIKKVGIHAVMKGKTEKEFVAWRKQNAGKKFSIKDYNWKFSDFKHKTFALTSAEATALLNNIAPNFWWFDNLQVKVSPDGMMEGSSTADIAGLKRDLFSDVAKQIPIPIPDRVNLYGFGNIAVTNNKLVSNPVKMEIGPVPLPKEYMSGRNVDIASGYLSRLYTVVPGLKINSLRADDGKFSFDGVIPQKVTFTKK